MAEEVVLDGIALSDGIAIGKGYFLSSKPADEKIPEFTIEQTETETEIERYRRALSSSRDELLNLQTFLAREGSDDAANIIDTHIQMLEDPIITEVEDRIRKQLLNTETVFRSVINEYENQFAKVTDSYFQQRLVDVRDLSQRIMWHLHSRHKKELETLEKNSIVLADEIAPSDAAEALSIGASGFVTQYGGATSHTTLIAKSRGAPFVSDVDLESFTENGLFDLIIDGMAGKVIINPSEKTKKEYKKLQRNLLKTSKEQFALAHLPSETQDKHLIDVMANIERVEDMDQIAPSGAAGVGLFRSEYLFLQGDSAMSDEKQSAVYRAILEKANGLPVTFRLFDVGGDKDFCPTLMSQTNPALGCRAIRFLMQQPEVFRIQVRALLKAAHGHNLRILIPLISDIKELRYARKLILSEFQRLELEGIPISKQPAIGAMIEVPSAVMMAPLFARECDFFSVGTNDLTQYTLAADRADSKAAFQPAHPSILRMIVKIAEASKDHKIPLSLCGDLAADPLYTSLLIGLGIKTLSCPPRYIPAIKQAVRTASLKDAQDLAQKACLQDTYADVLNLLKAER